MTYLKYIPWLIVVVALSFLSYFQWQSAKSARALLNVRNSELMQAKLDIGRANTKLVEQADLHKVAIEKINKDWKDEIKKREALLVMYGELEGKYEALKNGQTQVDLPKNKLYIRQDDGTYKEITSMAWSYQDFRISMNGDALKQTITYKLHQRFKGKMAESVLPGGARNYYFELYELDDKNQPVGKLVLDQFEVLKAEEQRPFFKWWNPKLDLGTGVGINTHSDFAWSVDMGLSISSYGATENDVIWRFFRIAAGITSGGFSLNFSPALYNIGTNLPLISNMWLHGYTGYNFTDEAVQFGIGLSVVF